MLADARGRAKFTDAQIANVSLIDEAGGRRVRMGKLAFVESRSINGVSALHIELMKQTVFLDLHKLYPDRINNKTNGITPRRWLMQCNPGLTQLVADTIGPEFIDDIDLLKGLDAYAGDAGFQEKFAAVKLEDKRRLAKLIKDRLEIKVSPEAMFDVQIKRIHEYKRQLLNIIQAVVLYDEIRAHPERDWVPRVKIFAGKAAPGYWNAKLIIKLINDVAEAINNDPAVRGLLKVVFPPNYNVSLAEVIVPAADLSEQISTVGMEALGTGNMKFMANSAITIGTMDGASAEMHKEMGADNIAIFGLTTEQVEEKRNDGDVPRDCIDASLRLQEVLESIATGPWWRAILTPMLRHMRRWTKSGPTARAGTPWRSAIRRGSGFSRPIGRSVNMPTISGRGGPNGMMVHHGQNLTCKIRSTDDFDLGSAAECSGVAVGGACDQGRLASRFAGSGGRHQRSTPQSVRIFGPA